MDVPRLEKRLVPLDQIELPAWVSWTGAVSFGTRSSASLEVLQHSGREVSAGEVISYRSKGEGDEITAARKHRNDERIHTILEGMGRPSIAEHEISQYAATPLVELLLRVSQQAQEHEGRAILDITGLTKFHTVVAAAESARYRREGQLTITYSVPENYVGFDRKERFSSGFGETLILPLVDGARMKQESKARGVILPGHEGQRLLVALGELEPVGGTFIHAITAGRPDFEQVTRFRNRNVYRDLREMGQWRDVSVDTRRMRNVSSLVQAEVRRAKGDGGPLLLYPFGPKPVIFAAAFTAARLYPEGTWFVYPVPTTNSRQHTEGVASTYWMNL